MLSGSLARAATAPRRPSLSRGAAAPSVGGFRSPLAVAPSSMPSRRLRRARIVVAAAAPNPPFSSPSSPSSSSSAKNNSKRRQSAGPIAYKSPGAVENDASDDVATSATETASDATTTSASPSSSKVAPFSWTRQWYPVAVESDLPKDRPVPVTLLGRRLVLWFDGGGIDGEGGGSGWSCLDDACSHRLAPLSEGRIDPKCSRDDGKTCRAISCSYHGFAFGSRGEAVSVPQARHDGGAAAERRAARSPRARVRSYPTMAADQLVWVWGEGGGDDVARDAASAPPPPGPPDEIRRLMVEAEEAGKKETTSSFAPASNKSSSSSPASPPLVALITNQQYFRDLPVPYDEMMTNLADQSHVPFAHTGVASNRDSPYANHFTVSAVNAHLKEGEEEKNERTRRRFPSVSPVDATTFDLEWAPDAIALAKQNVSIVPPCYIEYSTPLQSERDLEEASRSEVVGRIGLRACLWFYAVPLDESRTRIFNNAVVVAHGLPPWAAKIINARPKWVDHLFLHNVLDGDVAYLPQAAANEKLGLFSTSPSEDGGGGGGDGGESSSKALDPRGELWARRYYMPANADASVVAWRRWLHGDRGRSGWLDAVARARGGGGSGGPPLLGGARVGATSLVASTTAPAVPLPPSDLPRSRLFDRWEQHTKDCPSCARAMENARRWREGLTVAAVVGGFFASSSALLLLLSSTSSEAPFDARALAGVLLSSSVLSVLSLAGARAASTLESWFVYKDYEHWKS